MSDFFKDPESIRWLLAGLATVGGLGVTAIWRVSAKVTTVLVTMDQIVSRVVRVETKVDDVEAKVNKHSGQLEAVS